MKIAHRPIEKHVYRERRTPEQTHVLMLQLQEAKLEYDAWLKKNKLDTSAGKRIPKED